MTPPAPNAPDHRSRVAAEKRERMRLRLIESALLVFASKGVDAAVIDDVIAAAEVSRGTFYNYFRTNEEVLAAVSEELGNELARMVEVVVGGRADAAERLACGVRMFLHTVRAYPHLGRFICRTGINAAASNSVGLQYLLRDVALGMEAGRFTAPDAMAGAELVAGTSLAAVHALTMREPHDSYPEDMTILMLLGLGMTRAAAHKLVAISISAVELTQDSLLARTQARTLTIT